MPFAAADWFLEITFRDAANLDGRMSVELNAADYAAASAAATAYIAEIEPLTQAEIVQYALRESYTETAPVAGGGNIGEKASITVNLTEVPKRANLAIPAPAPAVFVAGTPTVDGTAVADLLALYEETGGIAFISDGETALDGAPFAGGVRTTITRRPR